MKRRAGDVGTDNGLEIFPALDTPYKARFAPEADIGTAFGGMVAGATPIVENGEPLPRHAD
jgi:hypothetical protein